MAGPILRKQLTIEIDRELLKDLKYECIGQDKTQIDLVSRYIREGIDRDRKRMEG